MQTVIVKPLVTDYAWLAGLIDGDGSFCWNTNVGPRLNIAMLHKPTIEHVFAVFGGSQHSMGHTPAGKPIWLWTGTASWCREHLAEVIPFLVTKRLQGQLFLEVLAIRKRGAHYTPEEKVRLDELYWEVKSANGYRAP